MLFIKAILSKNGHVSGHREIRFSVLAFPFCFAGFWRELNHMRVSVLCSF